MQPPGARAPRSRRGGEPLALDEGTQSTGHPGVRALSTAAIRHAVPLLLVLAGCAGNGQGLDQNGQPIGSGGGGSGALTPDFASIQDNVFTPICTRCHIGVSAPEGLQLDSAHSYSLLVGVPSAEQSSLLRVKPGDPDSSYIVRKLQGGPGISGGQMPLGGPPLPQSTIDTIRQWITDGAANSPASAKASARPSAPSFEVIATSPADAAHVIAPLTELVVGFSNELDAALVNATTVILEQIQPGTELLTPLGPPVPLHLQLAPGNPSAIVITPQQPLPPGRYRLTLRGTGPAALADIGAVTLGVDEYIEFTVEPAAPGSGA